MTNQTIILDNFKPKDVEGFFDISKSKDSLIFNGVEHKYHPSGLCRSVYLAPDGKSVLKLPNGELYDKPVYKIEHHWECTYSTLHNLLEAKCYEVCPDEYKKYFAKTKLLEYGWVEQEYVDVFEYPHSRCFREFGKTLDGRYVIFDYDVAMQNISDYNIEDELTADDFCYTWAIKALKEAVKEKIGIEI